MSNPAFREDDAEGNIGHDAQNFHVVDLFFAGRPGDILLQVFDIPGKPESRVKLQPSRPAVPIGMEGGTGIEHQF
jgi:hypothetical protein